MAAHCIARPPAAAPTGVHAPLSLAARPCSAASSAATLPSALGSLAMRSRIFSTASFLAVTCWGRGGECGGQEGAVRAQGGQVWAWQRQGWLADATGAGAQASPPAQAHARQARTAAPPPGSQGMGRTATQHTTHRLARRLQGVVRLVHRLLVHQRILVAAGGQEGWEGGGGEQEGAAASSPWGATPKRALGAAGGQGCGCRDWLQCRAGAASADRYAAHCHDQWHCWLQCCASAWLPPASTQLASPERRTAWSSP